MRSRSKARRWVLQILYAWEMRDEGRGLLEEAEDFFERRRIHSDVRAFAQALVEMLAAHLDEIDSLLEESAERWEVKRMAIIDRNLLRIAAAEFLHFEDVPFKVSIDEAVELAKRYGGADSPRFVNGVLDALAQKLDLIPS